MGDKWWILLMKSMLWGLRLVKSVVRLFVFVMIGLEVVWKLMFNFFVMIWVSVVFLSFGGLWKRMWLSVLLCDLVVEMKMVKFLWVFFWLMNVDSVCGFRLFLGGLFLCVLGLISCFGRMDIFFCFVFFVIL